VPTAATAGCNIHITPVTQFTALRLSVIQKQIYTSLFLNEMPVADKFTNIIWTIKSERISGGGGGLFLGWMQKKKKILFKKQWQMELLRKTSVDKCEREREGGLGGVESGM